MVLPMPTLSFKVSADEARRLRLMARRQGLSLSEFIRKQTLHGGKGGQEVKRVKCQFTGATIFRSPEGARPFTSESVREMLADFP